MPLKFVFIYSDAITLQICSKWSLEVSLTKTLILTKLLPVEILLIE